MQLVYGTELWQSICLSIFFPLLFQISSVASFYLLSSINNHFLLYVFQVSPLISPYNISLHALLPSISLAFLSFILATLCPLSVLPSLEHLPLISTKTRGLLLCSSLYTLSSAFLSPFASSLSSMDEATCCDLYAGRYAKSLPVGHIQPGPAVLLLMKFSSKGAGLFESEPVYDQQGETKWLLSSTYSIFLSQTPLITLWLSSSPVKPTTRLTFKNAACT